MAKRRQDNWTPGEIMVERRSASVPISIRMPRDIYDGLGVYANRVGTNRTYLILECLRRLLASKQGIGTPSRDKRNSRTVKRQ